MIVGSHPLLAGAAAPTTDPLFSFVVFLSNYEADFSDVKGHTVTSYGSPTISGGAVQFDVNKRLSSPASADFNFGGGDCCIEAIIEVPSISDGIAYYIACGYVSGIADFVLYAYNGLLNMDWYHQPGYTTITSPVCMTANTPTHIAVNRYGSTTKIYSGGIEVATHALTSNIGGGAPLEINSASSGAYTSAFKLHALRITKGHARYTAAFTPPTSFPEA